MIDCCYDLYVVVVFVDWLLFVVMMIVIDVCYLTDICYVMWWLTVVCWLSVDIYVVVWLCYLFDWLIMIVIVIELMIVVFDV